jgi:two-component system NtrC family sensor kinase
MILVIGVFLRQFHIAYQEKIRAHLEELVQKHKQNIDSFLEEKLGDIRFLAKTSGFEELTRETFLQDRLARLQTEFDPVFVDLGVVDEEGHQIAYAGPFKLEKARYSKAEWFEKAIQSELFISDVFLGLRGLPHFIVAVRSKWKGRYWILRSTIDFMVFNNLVENIRIGKTGFAFILNKKGNFQTKPLHDVVPDKGPYMDLIQNSGKSEDKISIIEAEGPSGKENIYVSAFLKNGDWMLVCQQNKADAFSDLYRTLKIAAMIFLLGGLGIITTAILISKRMVGRIAKANREKEMMNQQVVETGKLASIGELAAGIAHEINNPVAIMVEEAGWIQDLLEEEEFQQSENLDEFRRALNQINTQGKRCKEITHKLLSFARKTDSRVQVIQANDLIEEALELSTQRAKYSKVVFNTHLEKNLPFIQASQSEMQQVFLNMINNALDAMDNKGGTIDITTRFEDDAIVIDIADNGPGIHPDYLARIFDPFFSTKSVGKGTGLGLSICYGIINKMGGEITVASVIDQGTTFSIRIPCQKG